MLAMRAEESGYQLDRRITIYSREPDGRYARVDEHHVIHLYDLDAVTAMLTEHRLQGRDAGELRRDAIRLDATDGLVRVRGDEAAGLSRARENLRGRT